MSFERSENRRYTPMEGLTQHRSRLAKVLRADPNAGVPLFRPRMVRDAQLSK
jgi:hypothetical protein